MAALLIIFVIAIIIFIYSDSIPYYGRNECMVISTIDDEPYTVTKIYTNKQEAADILASINSMYVVLIKHFKRNKMNTKWAPNIEYLAHHYNPDVLGEHVPRNLNYTSYVRDKGKEIKLCLRTQDDRMKFHDMNTLKFVALHELSHMMTRSFGHSADFWHAFQFTLLEAHSLGIIKLIEYEKYPQKYCGISINSNPVFD
jgi:hypothetical protein